MVIRECRYYFLRDELEKLRSLRWETKATLSVIEDAVKMVKQKPP